MHRGSPPHPDAQLWMKNTEVFNLRLAKSMDINSGLWGASCILTEKDPYESGPTQFKHVLFNDQLYIAV